MSLGSDNAFLSSLSFTPDFLIVALGCFVLGYFIYSAIMAGVGAAVTAEQEGKQFAGIFTMVAVLPMMLSFTFMFDPNGVLPVVLTLIPFTAPLTIIMRWAMAAIPAWQLIASFVLMGLTVIVTVWVAARVFRLGMLMYGKRLTLREIVNALRQGRQVMTSVAGAEEA
ncbi:MAG: ABC transporter permease [Anaerolineae bacterium]|nr:ABC transporter permease [Anaerolineae bacterium]